MSVSLYGSGQTVIQVVQARYNTAVSTSSLSLVTTGWTASITPQSTNSKIMIFFSTAGQVPVNYQVIATVYRGGSNLATGSLGAFAQVYSGSGTQQSSMSFQVMDSPATTSSTTYTIYFADPNGASSVTLGINNTDTVITLMEISGS